MKNDDNNKQKVVLHTEKKGSKRSILSIIIAMFADSILYHVQVYLVVHCI